MLIPGNTELIQWLAHVQINATQLNSFDFEASAKICHAVLEIS